MRLWWAAAATRFRRSSPSHNGTWRNLPVRSAGPRRRELQPRKRMRQVSNESHAARRRLSTQISKNNYRKIRLPIKYFITSSTSCRDWFHVLSRLSMKTLEGWQKSSICFWISAKRSSTIKVSLTFGDDRWFPDQIHFVAVQTLRFLRARGITRFLVFSLHLNPYACWLTPWLVSFRAPYRKWQWLRQI